MKITLYFFVAIILACTLTYCDQFFQIEYHPEMKIRPINVELYGEGGDTIYSRCGYWVFEIDSIQADFYWIADTIHWMCSGYGYICIQDNELLNVFGKDELIDGSLIWKIPDHYSLENFKGHKNKYLAYRSSYTSDATNETHYYYGWISLYYSAGRDTLKIIELAESIEKNVAVKAGHR